MSVPVKGGGGGGVKPNKPTPAPAAKPTAVAPPTPAIGGGAGALDPTVVYALLRQAGATAQEATILTAIAAGESGWRADAHNPKPPDNSYGLFQINMLNTPGKPMGTNRLKQWGLTSNEQLFDPLTNAKAAVSILRGQGLTAWSVYTNDSYKNYLPAAQTAATTAEPNYAQIAAAAPTTTNADGTTTMTAQATTAATPFFGEPGAVASAKLAPGATPEQIEQYIRLNFPQAAGFLDIPEVRTVLIKAAKEQYTPTQLEGAMQATAWWRTNGVAARNYFGLKGTDPKQLEENIVAKQAEMKPMIDQLGLNLGGPEGQRKWAEDAIKYGWSDQQLKDKLANQLTKKAGQPGGLAEGTTPANTADGLIAQGKQYLVPISRADAENWAIRMMNGSASQESFQSWLTGLAKARYASQPDILAAIEGGMTPSAYFTGHKNQVADILEVDPDQIDLLDRKWSWMIETVDKNGNRRAPTLGEVQQLARDRPEFAGTRSYKETSAGYALEMSKFIGASA